MSSSNNSKLFTKRGSKRVKKKIIHNFLLPDDVIQFFQSVARHLSCPYNQDITFLLSLLIQLDVLTFFLCVCCLPLLYFSSTKAAMNYNSSGLAREL